MRVKFNWGIASYSGSRDDMTYAAYNEGYICLARRWHIPVEGLTQKQVAAIGANLADIWTAANPLYKADFGKYAHQNKVEHYRLTEWAPTSYALFIAMMFEWQKSDPTHLDLATVTLADIVSIDADVRTVARAVDAKFLRKVKGYILLARDM